MLKQHIATQQDKYAVQGLYTQDYGWETIEVYNIWLDAVRRRVRLDNKEPDIEHRIKTIKQGG